MQIINHIRKLNNNFNPICAIYTMSYIIHVSQHDFILRRCNLQDLTRALNVSKYDIGISYELFLKQYLKC